ncbi:hypothetical protein CO038_01380 [Candidatus Pacearchaeota archaeon CG_4_9_14_0_2_um_filter_39_13]|nr:STAS domain-containing protein [Candidatus Pacearchaeota archaeon]PJC44941.1 MAG: hypothetical protein CO038_01380 [Candidatus Pacearchaeota archaeon CG_4_9_14_0_2_um_filter_39_13]
MVQALYTTRKDSGIEGVSLIDVQEGNSWNEDDFWNEIRGYVGPATRAYGFDFSQVRHCSSSDLADLLKFRKQAMMNSATVALIVPEENMKDVLNITRLDRLFRVYDTPEPFLCDARKRRD